MTLFLIELIEIIMLFSLQLDWPFRMESIHIIALWNLWLPSYVRIFGLPIDFNNLVCHPLWPLGVQWNFFLNKKTKAIQRSSPVFHFQWNHQSKNLFSIFFLVNLMQKLMFYLNYIFPLVDSIKWYVHHVTLLGRLTCWLIFVWFGIKIDV